MLQLDIALRRLEEMVELVGKETDGTETAETVETAGTETAETAGTETAETAGTETAETETAVTAETAIIENRRFLCRHLLTPAE